MERVAYWAARGVLELFLIPTYFYLRAKYRVLVTIIRVLDFTNRNGKRVAVKLRGGVHPKHFLEYDWHRWYLKHLNSSDVVLDLGCGNLRNTEAMSHVARWVIGLDRRPPASLRLNVRTDAVDLELGKFPLPAESVDVVTMLDVLEHVDHRTALLREVRRVLKDGGRLLVAVPNRGTYWRRVLRSAGVFAYSDPDHKTEYTINHIRAELIIADFAVASEWDPAVYDTPWAGLIDAVGGVSLSLYRRGMQWRRRRAVANPYESTGFRLVATKTAVAETTRR